MVTKASYAYPTIKLSEGEARVRLEVYADALGDLPADILGSAFLEAIRTIKFFPSVSELRELAGVISRRKHNADWTPIEREEVADAEPLSEAERAEVVTILAEARRNLTSKEGLPS